MTARRPRPAPLTGRFLHLEPFDAASHADGLWEAIGRSEVFAEGYGGGPAALPRDRASYREWISRHGTGPDAIKFVARLTGGPDDGRIVGSSSLGDLDERNEKAHLGWTAWDPRVWGTVVNPEAKLLMLTLAFDHGYGRVKLQTADSNSHSRAAIAKLGATFEGVLRRDRVHADGTFAGTAIYSILREVEWPSVRAGLEARVRSFRGPLALSS